MVNIPLFTGFHTSQVVVWDFFHYLDHGENGGKTLGMGAPKNNQPHYYTLYHVGIKIGIYGVYPLLKDSLEVRINGDRINGLFHLLIYGVVPWGYNPFTNH